MQGGEYVRNGDNPVTNEALGQDAQWFDGDGMLGGVSFPRTQEKGVIQPEFVNQYILADIYKSSKISRYLRTPILTSVTTLRSQFHEFPNYNYPLHTRNHHTGYAITPISS